MFEQMIKVNTPELMANFGWLPSVHLAFENLKFGFKLSISGRRDLKVYRIQWLPQNSKECYKFETEMFKLQDTSEVPNVLKRVHNFARQ